MNAYELTLPEFAFVEGSDHEGDNNILKGRTVIQHIRSYTVLELFDKNDAVAINRDAKKFEFEYINLYGIAEQLILAVHFTFAEDFQLPEIFEKAASWYMEYSRWEDRNIDEDGF